MIRLKIPDLSEYFAFKIKHIHNLLIKNKDEGWSRKGKRKTHLGPSLLIRLFQRYQFLFGLWNKWVNLKYKRIYKRRNYNIGNEKNTAGYGKFEQKSETRTQFAIKLHPLIDPPLSARRSPHFRRRDVYVQDPGSTPQCRSSDVPSLPTNVSSLCSTSAGHAVRRIAFELHPINYSETKKISRGNANEICTHKTKKNVFLNLRINTK